MRTLLLCDRGLKAFRTDGVFLNEYIAPYGALSLLLIDFSLTVKAVTLIFIYGRGSAVSSARQGKSGSIYN